MLNVTFYQFLLNTVYDWPKVRKACEKQLQTLSTKK